MWLERDTWYPTSGVMNPLGYWGEPEMKTRGKMSKETRALCFTAVWKSRARKTQLYLQWKTRFKIMWDNTQNGFSTAQLQGEMVYPGLPDQLSSILNLLCFTSEVNFPQDGLTVNRSTFYSHLYSWHNSKTKHEWSSVLNFYCINISF